MAGVLILGAVAVFLLLQQRNNSNPRHPETSSAPRPLSVAGITQEEPRRPVPPSSPPPLSDTSRDRRPPSYRVAATETPPANATKKPEASLAAEWVTDPGEVTRGRSPVAGPTRGPTGGEEATRVEEARSTYGKLPRGSWRDELPDEQQSGPRSPVEDGPPEPEDEGDIGEQALSAASEAGRYLDNLERAALKTTYDKGLRMQVTVVPDAYLYNMASGIQELVKQGYEAEELRPRILSLHKNNSVHRNQMLARVSLEASGNRSYLFLSSPKLSRHFGLELGTPVSVIVDKPSPEPKFVQWDCFDGTGRGFRKRYLCALRRFSADLYSGRKYRGGTDPVTVSVKGLIVQSESADPNDSVNFNEKQLAIKYRDQRIIKSLAVRFHPGTWEVPEPPSSLQALLDRLAGKKSDRAPAVGSPR